MLLYIVVASFSFLSNGFCLNAYSIRLIVQPKIIAFEIRFECAQPSGPENRAPNGVINVPNQAPWKNVTPNDVLNAPAQTS